MTRNAFENVQEKGLIHKIVLLLDKVPTNSNYYFWFATCVESFLRGFHIPHQMFIAHTGLVYKLVKNIANNEITKFSNVQICYDLLGEIVKFNKSNVIFLENICVKFGWVDQLTKHALCNVIDSNVFFRSLWLSLEKFNYHVKFPVYFLLFLTSSRKEIVMKESRRIFKRLHNFARNSKKIVYNGFYCLLRL